MTLDLEEMIRRRAHEIWEREGRPHGRHEDHWQRAAQEITQELDRIKATHTPATAEEIESPTAPRKGRPRRSESGEQAVTPRPRGARKNAPGDEPAGSGEGQQEAPRQRGRKAGGEAADLAPATTAPQRRAAKRAEGAQAEPGGDAKPKSRRRRAEAADADSDPNAAARPAR